MAIKVFCQPPVITGYGNAPADNFQIDISWSASQTHGNPGDDGPKNFSGNTTLHISLGANVATVIALAYADIVTQCQANGMDTPSATDVFAHIPVQISALLQNPILT